MSGRRSYYLRLFMHSLRQNKCRPGSPPSQAPNYSSLAKEIRDMAVVRWDPFREVVALQSRLNSLFQNYGPSDYSRGQDDSEALAAASFAPPVDIYEDEHKLVLKLEVPGVRQEDLDIQIENRTLTVRGERKFANEEKQENFHRVEH